MAGLCPNWLSPDSLSDEALLAIAILFPILAYPFLPSVSRSWIRCEVFLLWSALIGSILILFLGEMDRRAGRPPFSPDFWLLSPAVVTTTGAWNSLFTKERSRKPRLEDFESCGLRILVYFTFANPFCGLFYFAEASFHEFFLRFVVTFTVGGIVFIVILPIYLVLFKFTTRQVPWWFWLPENGAREDFGPRWSMRLAVAMAVAPLAALFLAMAKTRPA